jgi:hypothetical protein
MLWKQNRNYENLSFAGGGKGKKSEEPKDKPAEPDKGA